MSSKADKYGAKQSIDEIEEISTRLAADLRKHIRGLGIFDMLSDRWCEMAEVCGRIAAISDVESSLSASKSDGTLWETEEQALRCNSHLVIKITTKLSQFIIFAFQISP